MIALGGAVMLPAIATGLTVLASVAVVVRSEHRTRGGNRVAWAEYQQQLLAEQQQEQWEQQPDQLAVAGGRRPATVSVTGVTPARPVAAAKRPAAALTAGTAGAPAPRPANEVRRAPDRPGVGARIRAGGKWGHVYAITQPVPEVTRFQLRMDDGTTGYVDIPDGDTLSVPADPFAAARQAQTHPVPAAPVARPAPQPPRPVRSAAPAAAPARTPGTTVSVGGFTLPLTTGRRS